MRLTTSKIVLSAFFTLTALAPIHHARAQMAADLYGPAATLTAWDGDTDDYFGSSIAMSGDTLVVGVPGDAGYSGSVRVFRRNGNGWAWVQTLVPGAAGAEFGSSVSLSGDRLAVGAPGWSEGGSFRQGAVYVFNRSGTSWVLTHELTATDGGSSDYLGSAVSIAGDTVAARALANGSNPDSVRVFVLGNGSAYSEQQTLVFEGGENVSFGQSLSLEGNTLAVAAPYADVDKNNDQGIVRVFTRSGGVWTTQATLTASGGASYDYFGSSVSLSADTLAVGVALDDVGSIENQGSVRVFARSGSTWSEQAMLTVPNELGLGSTLSLSGDTMAVSGDLPYGSVHVYKRRGAAWSEQVRLAAPSDSTYTGFGSSIAVSADTVAVGAPADDVNGYVNNGSVRVFQNFRVKNLTQGRFHSSLAEAISAGFWGDRLLVGAPAFAEASGIIDASDKRFTFTAVEPITLGASALMNVATGSVFEKSPAVSAGGLSIAGKLVAPENGTLTFEQLATASGGQFVQRGSTVLVNQAMSSSAGGACYLQGRVLAETVSTAVGGQNRVAGDTDIFGDYNNAGATVIQRGILYIYGTLTNSGTITGEFNNGFLPPNPGDGYSIGGDYIVSAESSIVLPDPVWWLRVGGSFDVAINSPSRFVMDQATLELTGIGPKGAQSVEVLSRDLGASESGFAMTNYPIGSLRLRAGATVELANNHNNAPGKGAEAVYTEELIVPAGATLVTNGLKIYTRAATIAGEVSDAEDIVIVPGIPPCAADLFPDGVVAGSDLTILLERWGPCTGSCIADIDRDGQVGAGDLAILLASWGPCMN